MASRGISVADVLAVLRADDAIENYPDDSPFPSRLLLDIVNGKPLHVVAAHDALRDVTYIVTTYEPNPAIWTADFRRRRP